VVNLYSDHLSAKFIFKKWFRRRRKKIV